MAKPKHAMLCKGTVRPRLTKSRTVRKRSSRAVPHAGRDMPEHPMLRRSAGSPGFVESEANDEDPSHAMLRTGMGSSKRTGSGTDRMLSERQMPRSDNTLPG